MSTTAARLKSGGKWAVAGRVLVSAASFAINVLIARILAPDAVGAFFLGISIINFIPIVCQAGLNQSAIKYIANAIAYEQWSAARWVTRFVLILTACWALIVVGSYVIFAGHYVSRHVFASEYLEQAVPWLGLWAFFMSIQTTLSDLFRGYHRIDMATQIGGLFYNVLIITCLLALYAFHVHASLNQIFLLNATSAACNVIVGLWLLRRQVNEKRGGTRDHIEISSILHTAWPIWINNIAVYVVLQANIWIVGAFLPPEDVARFGAASRLANVFSLISTMLYSVLPPVIADLHTRNEKKQLQEILRGAATINALLLAPPLIIALLYPGWTLGVIFGKFYSTGSTAFIFLAIANYFNAATGIRGYVLLMTGHERTQLMLAIFSGTIGLILLIFAARAHNLAYCGLASMIGIVFQCSIEMYFVKRLTGTLTHFTLSKSLPHKILRGLRK